MYLYRAVDGILVTQHVDNSIVPLYALDCLFRYSPDYEPERFNCVLQTVCVLSEYAT